MRVLPHLCPICGQPNQCGMAVAPANEQTNAPCWCRDITIAPDVLARVPAAQLKRACVCPRCSTSPASTRSPER